MKLLAAWIAIGAITLGAHGQTEDASAASTAPPAPPDDSAFNSPIKGAELTSRLEALKPSEPWAYFELAEEIGLSTDDQATRSLARTLFVLAYETSKQAGAGQPRVGGADLRVSVCLALAALTPDESEQRWLRAMAASLGWKGTGGELSAGQAQPAAADPAALELASALGLIRIAEGRRAAKLLEKPEVSRLLERTERLLSPGGLTGGAARVRRLMAEWPICSECKNRRFVKSQQGVRLCPTCGGKPGPEISRQELMYQLRLESSLLNGVQRSWVAQTVVDGGAPLRDLDLDELAAMYGVDPAKTVWRDSQWAAPAESAAKPAPRVDAESGG